MACVDCVQARLEGKGRNFTLEGGEIRILGCTKHAGLAVRLLEKAVKEREKARESSEGTDTSHTPDSISISPNSVSPDVTLPEDIIKGKGEEDELESEEVI